jgi:hypothetical protein
MLPLAAPRSAAKSTAMTDEKPGTPDDKSAPLPDRLCNDPASTYYDAALLERGVGIRFKGQERTNVEEYCVSEGWIRVTVGNTKDRYGNPLTMKIHGAVEPYIKG